MYLSIHQSELWRRTNHCVLFRSPLSLFSSSKTHLAAGNRDSKCQGFNDHTFSQEETLAGGVPNVRGLQKHRLHRNSRTAKNETDGLAGVATALWGQCGPSLFGQGPCCCATPRSSLLCLSCPLATGRSAVSPAPIKVID
jgi:hypothetical protein